MPTIELTQACIDELHAATAPNAPPPTPTPTPTPNPTPTPTPPPSGGGTLPPVWLDWATQSGANTDNVTRGSIWVGYFTVGAVAPQMGTLSYSEYQGPPTSRIARLYADAAYTQELSAIYGSIGLIPFGSTNGLPLNPGQTYYLWIQSGVDQYGNVSNPGQSCNMIVLLSHTP